ncbi:receptor expression-enhancing protein 5-like [Sipha flava]|uniref:Receptor expression-enhancing protein n=1 Tax=Sipha flava TaxID=143950 RepID=A0A2S2QKS8_9HEMI|nr:receptor expression-enhancing protein 5-like [Sipha flava]XP_025424134.1 receptor expression-enhancing protein 5-like [Sipha flava]
MTSKIDTAKAAIKNALYDESKPWYKLFNWAEAQTGVNRLNLFFGFAVFIVFYLLIGYGTLLLSNLIGFLYPAYASIKAVESSGKDDDTKWLTYWVVFSFITLIEFPAEIILQWIPFYSLIKTIFFVWCFIPIHNNGSVVVYSKFIRPYFLKHQGDIDQAVNDLSEKATEVAFKKLVTEKVN